MSEIKQEKKPSETAISDGLDSFDSSSSTENNNTKPLINQGSAKKKKKVIGIASKVYSLAVKCYEEQLPWGEMALIKAIKDTNKKDVQVLAVKHDRDTVTDGIWAVASVKPHWHIIIRMTDRKKTMRVRQILDGLGIVFRQGEDDSLWENRGVETCRDFSGYAMYLTHETKEAIADAKERYDISELVSNLTIDEIDQVRQGYIRVSENRKVSEDELIALDQEAYDLGYAMKNFQDWYDLQPFRVRSNTKMRIIKESYDRGVSARIEKEPDVNRLCIFIQGSPNTGKTYASKKALDGKQILSVGGGGTGKFDRLRPDHDAIVIDDDVCPNLLNMTDNYICHAYKRNKDNPAWAGEYFIVTSNLSFEEWLENCGIRCQKADKPRGWKTEHCYAMISRFFICRLKSENGVNHLACESASTRGSADEQTERVEKFLEFKKKFDETISCYTPMIHKVDFSSVIERVDSED